jgi:hypothetical protein
MKVLVARVSVSLLACFVGIAFSALWRIAQNPPIAQGCVTVLSAVHASNSQPPPTVTSQNDSNPSPDRIPVASHPEYPFIVSTLEKLVALKGRERSNILYVSPVERAGI